MKIKVIYLARLSEDIGKKEEYIDLLESKQTIKDVYLKLELDKINYEITKKDNKYNFENDISNYSNQNKTSNSLKYDNLERNKAFF